MQFIHPHVTRDGQQFRRTLLLQYMLLPLVTKAVTDSKLRAISVRYLLPLHTTTVRKHGAPWRKHWKSTTAACSLAPCTAILSTPFCDNMTLSTKPEVRSVLHCHRKITEPRRKIGRDTCDICSSMPHLVTTCRRCYLLIMLYSADSNNPNRR